VEGPRVADDVASTLVRLDLDLEDALPPSSHGVEPLGWSSDGTELLVTRWKGFVGTYYVVHADGTKTRVPNQSPGVGAAMAAISPDGSRVVFESQGLAVVDIEGGRAVKLPYPTGGEPDGSVTFSSDGTQIAYIANGRVWLVNADGTDAHEILADEPALVKGADSITWSPAGDRLAVGLDDSIYTFAPDGSDFAKVITDGSSPFWSPDGSQIAYNGPSGLAIADADGSNIRAFGFASSGPWHPGESLPVSPAVPLVWSPVQERDALTVHRGGTWEDPRDASVRWVDVTRVRYSHADNQPFWSIELAAKPPPPASREPGQLIAHGLVLDTTGDGVADYEVGIDNDAPQPGDFHVWITDLATGKTDEQIGPPYGLPIEFGHPHVRSGDLLSPGALYLTFLYGTAPADLDPATVRFYAWASASRDGKVFASDYAPDTGWMTRT
jgi:hypothetical protein